MRASPIRGLFAISKVADSLFTFPRATRYQKSSPPSNTIAVLDLCGLFPRSGWGVVLHTFLVFGGVRFCFNVPVHRTTSIPDWLRSSLLVAWRMFLECSWTVLLFLFKRTTTPNAPESPSWIFLSAFPLLVLLVLPVPRCDGRFRCGTSPSCFNRRSRVFCRWFCFGVARGASLSVFDWFLSVRVGVGHSVCARSCWFSCWYRDPACPWANHGTGPCTSRITFFDLSSAYHIGILTMGAHTSILSITPLVKPET